MKTIDWLKLPETMGIEDFDEPATTLLHAEIIQKKAFLKIYILIFINSLKRQ